MSDDAAPETWISKLFGYSLMAFIAMCCIAGAVGMALWIVKAFATFCIICTK